MSAKQLNFKKTLFISLAAAVICAALGLYFAQTQLCPDQILAYQLMFPQETAAFADPVEKEKWLIEQQIQILLAARKSMPAFADRLQFRVNSIQPVIDVSLKSTLDRDVETRFLESIKRYCHQTVVSHSPSTPDSEADRKPDNAWLEELTQKEKDLRDQIQDVQKQYQKLNLETLSLEHRLDTNQIGEIPDFDDQMERRLTEQYNKDDTLIELNRLHETLAVDIADLDLQAGRCRSGEQLRELDSRREQLNQQLQHVHQRIVKRQQWLAQQLFEEFRPLIERKIKLQIDYNLRQLASYKADLDMLNQSLDRLTSHLVDFQQNRPDTSSDQPGQINDTTPVVEFSTDHFHKKTVLSLPQWIVIVTAAVAGLAIGFLIASVGSTLGKNTTSKIDDDEPLEKPRKSDSPLSPPVAPETLPVSDESPEEPSPVLATIDIKKDISDSQAASASSGWTDEYDTLAQSVLDLQSKTPCPVVILSALTPKECSPRIAVNLAIAMARKKCRTLLIEADPASTNLADIFDQSSQPGFYEWRRGEHWASRLIDELPLPGLSFMPAGHPDADQAQPDFDPDRERHRWENLKKNYDAILLFCPAALVTPAQTPEHIAATQTLDLADALLAMAKPDRHLDSRLQSIKKSLQPHTAEYLGFIAVKN